MEIQNIFSKEQSLISLEEDFLIALISQKEREIYARIIALDINENPVDQIEGKISTGSISVDGNSAVRRTCSLTMISENVDINNFYWGIKTKFKLEVGLYNKLNNQYSYQNGYPNVIWFSQGYYVISTFNTSISTNNCTISLQGKDKMSLLNGDLGGQLPSEIDFGAEEIITKKMELLELESNKNSKDIISQVLNKYYIKIDNENQISINNNDYLFILDNKNGNYKKDNYFYNLIENKEENKNYYSIYKLIQNLEDLFIPVESLTNEEYVPNKFYYQNKAIGNKNYYVLDGRNNLRDIQYFICKSIYKKYKNITKEKIPLEKIIRESVHAYGKEPYYNIIINDLDDYGLEQLTYKGKEDCYILYNDTEEFSQLIFKDTNENFKKIVIENDDFQTNVFIDNISFDTEGDKIVVFNNDFQGKVNNSNNTQYYNINDNTLQNIPEGAKIYSVAKITYGMDIGYYLTDLVYAGDLISNAGDTLTSMLDKIKNMLIDFEYFYDINGKFIFQRKKTYINTSWNKLTQNKDEIYIDYSYDKNKFSFNFEDSRMFTAIQNNPVLNNVRNDFIVWGKRKGDSGADIPIHARYAIDKKPLYYQTLNGRIYLNEKNFSLSNNEEELYLKENTNWLNFKTLIKFLQIKPDDIFIETILSKVDGIVNLEDLEAQFDVDIQDERDNENENIDFCEYFYDENQDVFYIKTCAYSDIMKNPNDFLNPVLEEGDRSQLYIYVSSLIKIVDWREIIYQMALDYFAGQGCSINNPVELSDSKDKLTNPDNFLYEVAKRNLKYYPTGYTGYEQYYTDMQGFWRQLYNPDYIPKPKYSEGKYIETIKAFGKKQYCWEKPKIIDYDIQYYLKKSNLNIQNQINVLLQEKINLEENNNLTNEEKIRLEEINNIEKKYYSFCVNNNMLYWNINVFKFPETLNFWIDFLDNSYELAKFSISQIGDRTKVIKDDKVNSLVYTTVPNIIFYNTNEQNLQAKKSGYTFVHLPSNYSQYFTISYRTTSIINKIDDLLYQHSYCTENISLTSIPIYYLEPNTRVYVKDENTNINGEYIVTKFTIPLTYNGIMSITANKAPERLI